jgi:hypothetical protein
MPIQTHVLPTRHRMQMPIIKTKLSQCDPNYYFSSVVRSHPLAHDSRVRHMRSGYQEPL